MSQAMAEAIHYRNGLMGAWGQLDAEVGYLRDYGSRCEHSGGDEFDEVVKAVQEAIDELSEAIPCEGGLIEFVEGLEGDSEAVTERAYLLEDLARELDDVAPRFAIVLRDIMRAPFTTHAYGDGFGFARQSLGTLIVRAS